MKQILLALIFLSSNFLTSFEKFKLNNESYYNVIDYKRLTVD